MNLKFTRKVWYTITYSVLGWFWLILSIYFFDNGEYKPGQYGYDTFLENLIEVSFLTVGIAVIAFLITQIIESEVKE